LLAHIVFAVFFEQSDAVSQIETSETVTEDEVVGVDEVRVESVEVRAIVGTGAEDVE
jgi:hypothetical protein